MQEEQRPENSEQRSRRGFASMTPEKQRAIASLGGRAAHQLGVAHEWDRQQAQEAGKKGGRISGEKRRTSNRDDREELL